MLSHLQQEHVRQSIARTLIVAVSAALIMSSCSVSQGNELAADDPMYSGQADIGTVASIASDPKLTDRHARMFRLYNAVLGRVPDAEGAEYWIQQIDSACLGDLELAYLFLVSSEFRTRFETEDDRLFVELLYKHTLLRDPDTEGHEYWTRQIDAGVKRVEVVLAFSDSPEFRASNQWPSDGVADRPCQSSRPETPTTTAPDATHKPDEAEATSDAVGQTQTSPVPTTAPPSTTTAATADPVAVNALPAIQTVLFVGDSLVTGRNSYVDEVREALTEDGEAWDVRVCGAPGLRTQEAWDRCEGTLTDAVNIVVFSLGTNDIVGGVNSAEIGARQLASIVRDNAGRRTVVVLPAVFNEQSAEAQRIFRKTLSEELVGQRLRFVDPFNHLMVDQTTDGIHLRQAGADAVGAAVVLAIRS